MKPIRILIPQELFVPAALSHYEEDYEIEELDLGVDRYVFEVPVHWSADITNTGEALLVTGSVEGDVKGECARCLEDARFHVKGQIEGYFLIKPEAELPEDMGTDEYEILPEDKTIDLAPLIKAALVLEMPLVPLCSDDCLGLCPKCGANLNEGDCGCKPDEEPSSPSNPFAALKDYKFN